MSGLRTGSTVPVNSTFLLPDTADVPTRVPWGHAALHEYQ